MNVSIQQEQLASELQTLASFSDTPSPSVTRIVFSEKDLQARAYLKQLATDAGLEIREDAVGNTFFRWRGTDAGAVATGSHIDAIPHAGAYDGTVGVLGGLEAIRALQRSGFRPRRSIDLILFTSEEPTRFGIGCLGSRFLSGNLNAADGSRLRDSGGKTLDEVRQAAGFQGELNSTALPPDAYSAFVELHIEQGPLLERQGLPLGIVTAIAAPASLRLLITGEGGHAGAVLMPQRHDAFLAAAEISLAAESAAKGCGAIDGVATVGVCRVFPGAINSIPSRTEIEMDVRDIDQVRRDGMLSRIQATVQEVATRRGVTIDTEIINVDAPAYCAPEVVDALSRAADAAELRSQQMVSRAYHDSLFMSRRVPASMLFIPCRNGVSHRPDEYATPEAIAQGTLVLAYALRDLAGH